MLESRLIWMNGELVEWKEAKVHVLTHALHYGTAVFEGIRCFSTEKGPEVFRLRDHIVRLIDSTKIYLMNFPLPVDEICRAVKETIVANKLQDCYVRPLAYYSYGEMGINPLPNKVSLAIAAWEWPSYLGEKAEKEGLRCQVSSWRRIHSSAMPPQAKATANYANASLAKIEALKAGYDEAIMLNQDNHVAEATGENVFKVKEGIISTPPASAGALRGITRDTIIQIAKDMCIEFRRNEFSREELYISDEVFLTGTAAGVTAVREIDGRKVGNGRDWPVTTRLRAAYQDIVHGKTAKYSKWLDYV